MTIRRKTMWIAGALVVAFGVAGFVHQTRASRGSAMTFETVPADRGPIVERVTASGTLSALVTVQVGSQVSGRLQQILVDYNSPVKKGEVIAKIDPQLFEAAYEQARANQVAAEGNLAKAKTQAVDADRQYQRAKALAADQIIGQQDLETAQASADTARAAVKAAEGSLEQARAALHAAQVNLDYATIRSPIDGVVISRNVDVGQTVAASLQAPTLFVIAEDPSKMQVDTSVAEADVGKLAAAMPAQFTVEAYPGIVFHGTVRQVRSAPQTIQNVVTYDAVIDVANDDLKLKPGMTANVTFIHAQRENVLRVPNAALRFRPAAEMLAAGGNTAGLPAQASHERGRPAGSAGQHGGSSSRTTVWVLRGSSAEPVRIETGITDGSRTEVLSGQLEVGDQLITEIEGGTEVARAARPSNAFRAF